MEAKERPAELETGMCTLYFVRSIPKLESTRRARPGSWSAVPKQVGNFVREGLARYNKVFGTRGRWGRNLRSLL